MQFHDKLHNVFVELVLCRCVSQWQELTNQEKHTNAKCTSTQIQKYTLYLWTRRCTTASPSDRNPLSSTTHNNQQFFSSVPDPECTPSYLLTDNPASPTAITIASYANALRPSKVLIWFKFDKLVKLGWFKPWERLFYTFGNVCKFHQRIHIFQIHFWNI